MQPKAGHLYALVMAFSLAILYGTTYQQFRFFSLDAPGGAADAVHYVQMSGGDFGVDAHHRYRWVTPAAAGFIRPVVEGALQEKGLAIGLSFYIVNFAFSLGACLALFALLRAIGFSVPLSMLGICAYASSRITVLVTATPMADAAYFCAVATLAYLAVARRYLVLAVLLPLMVLCKETALVLLLLPLLTDMRKTPAYWVALIVSLLVFVINRLAIDSLFPGHTASFAGTVLEHMGNVPESLRALVTLSGLHDLQAGFSFLLVLAAAGAWLNAKHGCRAIPGVVIATLPIGFGLALMSGNLGRMFFAAFPAVIAWALIAIEHVARPRGPDTGGC